jgi:hypothetical protein
MLSTKLILHMVTNIKESSKHIVKTERGRAIRVGEAKAQKIKQDFTGMLTNIGNAFLSMAVSSESCL